MDNTYNNQKYEKDKPFDERIIYELLNKSPSDKDIVANDPVTDLFIEKLAWQKAAINQLLYLISKREMIKENNLSNLEKEICNTHTLELNLPLDSYIDVFKHEGRKIMLEKTASNLEKNKGMEIQSCWSDTAKLKQEIIPLISQYLATKRKAGLVGDIESYSPKEEKAEYVTYRKEYTFPERIP